MIGLVSVTAAGQAARNARRRPGPTPAATTGPPPRRCRRRSKNATRSSASSRGAAVRLLAPLLQGKHADPGVVCVDEALRFAVPVLGAHRGGGNELARRVAETLGAEPVITTASDATGATGSMSSAPTWASASSRAATWPPWAPRSCPASG